MKIKTGEIADKNKDKNVVSSVKLSRGTRVGTLKLTVNGEEQDSVPIRGLGGGSSTVIGGSVDTQALWDAINKKVDVDFFKNLFTVYDSSDIEIATNTYTRKPDNLKISVGTWTEEYLSALGKNSEGGGGGGVGTVTGIALGTGTTPIYPDDDTGIVTLPAYPTKVSQLANDKGFVTSSVLNNYVTSSYLANNFYTKAQADNKYMTIAAFENLFNALDSNGDKIDHPYSSGVDSIKALVGLWTEQYLSALGQNGEGGGGGTGTVTAIEVAPNVYRDPDDDGIIHMIGDVVTSTERTKWNAAAANSHTHSNKAALDTIDASKIANWNNVATIMTPDGTPTISRWPEVVSFLSGYTTSDSLSSLLANKVDVRFFNSIFTVYDDNGNAIVPNTYTQVADNLKIMVGAWTEQYLSALGKNSEESSGTGDVSHIKISSNPDVYLDPVEGIIDMSSYAATWNAKANRATTLAGYGITDAKITNGTTITLGNNSITPLTANSSLAWSKLTGTPTTLAGYGIGDAKISNGVITLGSTTITPVTSVGLSAPTGFSVSGSPVTKTGTLTFAYASGYEGFTTSLKEKIEALYSWFEVDANGDVKTKNTAGGHVRGFYTESFVSALGKNSQEESSDFDEEQMWKALGTDTTTKVIDTSHIPDMASTYGYLKASALNGYATQTWVNQQGFVKSSGVTSVAMTVPTGLSVSGSPITSTGTLALTFTSGYSIPTTAKQNNWDTAYGWGNHASAGYALASDVYSSSESRTANTVLAAPNGSAGAATFRALVAADIPSLAISKITNLQTTLDAKALKTTTISAGNGLTGGGDLSSNRTINVVSANAAITVNADNIKLNVINDYTTTTNNTIIPLAAARGKDLNDRLAILESWFEEDANGNIKTKDMSNGTHRGFYTESFVSALGLNGEGGGGMGDVSHIKIGTNPDVFLDPDEDGIIDMSSYAANWNDAYNKRHTHSNKSVLDGITSTKVSHWDAVYGVVPSAAYESGNQLADKNFVNSSISTSTATFRGTNTTATTESAFLTWANGLTHDLNDYVFWSTKDSAGNTIYKRYKYDGSQWVFEYDLNNSSFTSDQWSAINSGITSTHVTKLNGIASGAQVNVIESVKVNGTALSISSKAVDITAVPLTIITGADDLKAIEGISGTGFLKRTGNNTWALDTTVVLNTRKVSTGNGLQGGGDLSADRTISILLPANSGLSVASTGLKLDIVNNLTTASDYRAISATQAKKIWDLLNQMFTLEGSGTTASPYVIKANYGLYTNQFLSALGQNSQGGGGGMGEDEMWAALQANTGTYENAKINWNHIPLATASTAGAIKVGSTLAISNGILNQATIPNLTADVYTKVTVDTYGRVTQGGDLLADDIPTLSMSKISGLSTALGNVYTKTESDGKYITAIGTNGNYLTYTKNGNSNSITVPYATTANSLKNLYNYSTRPTSANLTHINNGGVQHFLATSSMATNKPANDGHILHFHWDTTAGWDSQLFLSDDPAKPYLQYRAENGDSGVWGSWITVLDTNNTYVTNGKGYINGTEITTISGNAATATKLGTTTVGSSVRPIYLNSGVPTQVSSVESTLISEPSYVSGGITPTTYPLVNTVRTNKLVLLPAEQVIIEKTTDGGATWVDYGASNAQKEGLFTGSFNSVYITIPKINGEKSKLCGIRITITGMKYNVPSGTPETQKYNYWNSNYYSSTERYCSIESLYFWVACPYDRIRTAVYVSTGANPNTWIRADKGYSYLSGNTGGNIVFTDQNITGTFGGYAGQTGNKWNYRFEFFTDGLNGADLGPTTTSAYQYISRIQGFGRNGWVSPNNLFSHDHIYTWDENQVAIFPYTIRPYSNNNGNLGTAPQRWANVYATAIDASTGSFSSNVSIDGTITNKYLAIAESWTDTWSDGTHTHPWYGIDGRWNNTGVYSTTISDYYGLTLKTGGGNISMKQDGNVGIGTFDPSYKLDVNGTARLNSTTYIGGSLNISTNNANVNVYDTNGNAVNALKLDTSNTLRIGGGSMLTNGYNSVLYGRAIYLYTGTNSSTPAVAVNAYGRVAISNDLEVANGITLTTTKKITFGTGNDAPYIELDSNGYFHFSAGLYSDSFVSALGANDQGGGGSTFDEEQMWQALGSDPVSAKKIDNSHLNIAAWAKAANKPSYAWSEITNKPSWIGASKPTYTFSEIGSTPTTLAGYGITDAASSSRVTTIEGYFTNGVAKKAYHLNRTAHLLVETYPTVGEMKAALVSLINQQDYGIGDNVTFTDKLISKWNDDSATLSNNGVYTMTKIGGGYNSSRYGQWLLSYYGSYNIGVIGRDTNSWTSIKWLAWTDGTNASGTWGIGITGNAATATKLQTARTIWGQSFDGSANVSGNMTGVDSIDSLMYFDTTNSRIGIGNSAPSYKLDLSGSFRATGNSVIGGTLGVTGAASLQSTLNVKSHITTNGDIKMDYDKCIYFKDNPSSGSQTYNIALFLSSSNELHIGYGTASNGYTTNIYGNSIVFKYGKSRTNGFVLSSDGNVGIGTTSPSYKLHVNGYTSTTRLYLSSSVYLEYDSTNGGIHVVGAGLYSDSYVSALGVNSQGGGGSTFDEEQMWKALNSSYDDNHLEIIDDAHLPKLDASKITSGTFNSSRIPTLPISKISGLQTALDSFATQSWVNTQLGNYVTLGTAQTITGAKTFNEGKWIIASQESNEISSKYWDGDTLYNNANTSVLSKHAAIKNAIRFRWYDSYWNIGNIRSGNTATYGFGIALEDTTNNRLIDCLRVTQGGTYIQGYTALHAGNSYVTNGKGYIYGTEITTISGNAATATKLGTSTVGSSTAPIYLNSGVPTASTANFIFSGDVLQTTNPFTPLKKLYISKIDNAFYAAEKRFTVTGEIIDGSTTTEIPQSTLHNLFDGSYETAFGITNGKTAKIHIRFDGYSGSAFPGYPYGFMFLSFYHVCKPTSVSARCYCNYEPQGIGWHDMSIVNYSGGNGASNLYRVRNDFYNIQEFEFTIVGDTTNSYGYTALTQIEMNLDRPDSSRTPFLSKYAAETLYYPLTIESNLNVTEGVVLNNNKAIFFKDASGTGRNTLYFDANNNLALGYGTAGAGYKTYIEGNNIYLRYGTSHTTGFVLNSAGNIGVGTTSPSYKLDVNGTFYASGNSSIGGTLGVSGNTTVGNFMTVSATNSRLILNKPQEASDWTALRLSKNGTWSGNNANTKTYIEFTDATSDSHVVASIGASYTGSIGYLTFGGFYKSGYAGSGEVLRVDADKVSIPSGKTLKIGDCTISWDSTNSMLKFDTGIYSTGAVSALGANSQGGGGGDASLNAVWGSLTTYNDEYKDEVIDVHHIPNLSWAKITNRPTTLSGYGILDAYTKTQADAKYATISSLSDYLPLSGGTMTGILKWKDINALPETASPAYMLTIDSFASGGTTKWANLTNVTVGKATTATKLGASTVGSSVRPIYLNNGVPTQVTSIDGSIVGGYIGHSEYGYLVTHPEATRGVIIPYIYNDLAFLTSQGGSYTIYSTTETDLTKGTLTVKTDWSNTGGGTANMFDGSPAYWNAGNGAAAEMNADGLIIDIALPELKPYNNRFYIDFGNASWGFDNIDILLKNSANETNYVSKVSSGAINNKSQYYVTLSHTSTTSGGTISYGFDRMRIHLYGRTSTGGVRIAQIGLIRYNSIGHRYTMMSRGFDDYLYRSITPNTTSTYSLGTSARRWNNIYGTTLNLSGTATIGGDLVFSTNAKAIYFTDTNGRLQQVFTLLNNNNLLIGGGSTSANYNTYIDGKAIFFRSSSSHNTKLTLTETGDTQFGGSLYLENAKAICAKDSNGSNKRIAILQSNNILRFGIDTPESQYQTFIDGYDVLLRYGTSHTTGLTLNNLGQVIIPSTGSLKIGNATLSWDSTNQMLKVDKGFYSTGAVSALGSNSEGGGSGAGLEDVWDSLTNQQGTVITDNTKIAIAHIPDTSSTYGYLKASALSGYATQAWVNQQGFLTTHQTLYTLSIYGGTTKVLDFKPNANASIYIKAGGDISLTNDTTNKYITLSYTHPTNGANTTISAANGKVLSAITVNSLGHVTSVSSKTLAAADIPDISATYATASRATTLEGYFTDGVAKNAAKLSNYPLENFMVFTNATNYVNASFTNTAYSAKAHQTYIEFWDGGTDCGWFNFKIGELSCTGATTLSSTLSVTGATTLSSTLGVTGATTLTGLLTANGNIKTGTSNGAYIQIGAIKLVYDSTNNALKVIKSDDSSANFYATGAVSALGANSSGGGGGNFDEDSMWAALDATNEVIGSAHIPNLNANKITSGTFADARIPSLAASKITSGTFAAARIPDLSSKYLPLSGGTIATNSAYPLIIADSRSSSTLFVATGYKKGSTTLGYLGFSSQDVPVYVSSNAGNSYPLLHSDNYSSYALPLTGGTITLSSIDGLTINKSTNAAGMIRFTNGSTLLGYLGYYGIENPACNVGGTYYSLVHGGNYDSIIGDSYIRRKTYGLDGGKAVRITFSNVNGGIINVRSTLANASLILVGNGYGEGGTTRNNWVQISESTSWFSWCIPTASGIEKSVEIYNNSSNSASVVVAAFDAGVTFTELSALSTTASTVKVAYASDFLPLTGGTMTGSIKMDATNKGYYLVDSAGVSYPALWDNGSYLCIGANAVSGTHHTGNTYISAGSGEVYISRLVNNSRTSYKNLDAGNTYVSSGKGYLNDNEITTISGNAATATKATQDGDGRTITSTYLTSVGISGDYITQTKGGTTSNVANIFYRDCTIQYTLTTAGWYRIAAFSTNLAHGGTCFLLIRRTFNVTSPESYIFAITLRYGSGISISQLSGTAGVHLIDKIRVEYANNTSFAPQIDIHVSSTTTGNSYRITTIGSAAPFATATLNPTVANSTYEYTTRDGMSCSGDFYAGGEVTAASDERLKTIVGDGNLDLRYIANAPNVLFRWNDGRDDKVHGGSLAQYFLTGAKHFVLGSDKDYYSLNYGALATSMAISIAKEVVKHEDRITLLEKENARLKARVAELEERRIA